MSDNEARAAEAIERIQNARRKQRTMGLLFGTMVLALFVYYGNNIYGTFTNFDEEVLMESLNRKASHKVWPVVTSSFERVVAEAAPVLAKSFGEQVDKDWPKVEKAFEREMETLGKNLQGHEQKIIVAFADATKAQSKDVFKKHFADLKPAQVNALSDQVGGRVQSWSQSQYASAVEANVKALVDIKGTLAQFRPGDGQNSNVQPEDILELTLDVLNVRLAGEGQGGKKR